MKIGYITIEREYGSGGTEIARRLSAESGIPCYGQEILELVSETYHIPVKDIDSYEEHVTNSFLYSVYVMAQSASASADMLTNEGHIFIAEQAAIKTLADQGKAIFLGHCAAEALKGKKGVVRVFVRCSDAEEKRRRIVAGYGIPEGEAEKTRRRFDKKRANYYYANTAKKWDDMRSYDLVLDSGVLGIDGCVNVLKSLLINY